MFLTRFEVNPARREARALLATPNALHAAVLAGFPADGEAAGPEGRLLWRLDQEQPKVLLYVVSQAPPDLTHLVESAGWPTTQGWETRDYSGMLRSLSRGERWAFRLTANPTRSGKRSANSTQTQRFGHLTSSQQVSWLLARAEANGFVVPDTALGVPEVIVQRRTTARFARQGQTVTLSTVVFEGLLEVLDGERLARSLVCGIGPAKAYGCGLLTLARPSA